MSQGSVSRRRKAVCEIKWNNNNNTQIYLTGVIIIAKVKTLKLIAEALGKVSSSVDVERKLQMESV